ncbi:MAG: ribonuclease HII [Candidatus Bipolaricaulota bacterium]
MPQDRVGLLLEFDLALARGERVRDVLAPSEHEEHEARDGAPCFLIGPRPFRGLALVGLDEAGRGALAGPVAVGCVAFSPEFLASPRDVTARLAGLDDSKCLSPVRRERLYAAIARCASFSVGFASAVEIDRDGIVAACNRAAQRAYARLGVPADLVVLDRGLSLGTAAASEASFTRGDSRSLHVAAASIVAKVTRDRLLQRLEAAAPGYGLATHKGYGTAAHFAAIALRGPSPLHRATFLGG